MSIHVALIDKSEIIHKMLSHCLYYYTVEVHRFDSLDSYIGKFHDSPPSLIFLDWEIKQEDQPLIYKAKEQFPSIPCVLLYRQNIEGLDNIPNSQIPYRVKKPINPKEVRDICAELIPELKSSTLPSFLKFPKAEENKKQAKKPTGPLTKPENVSDNKEDQKENTQSFIGSLIQKTGLLKTPPEKAMGSEKDFALEKKSKTFSGLKETKEPAVQTEKALKSPVSNINSKSRDIDKQPSAFTEKSFNSNEISVKTKDKTLTDSKTFAEKKTVHHSTEASPLKEKQTATPEKSFSKSKSFDINSKVMETKNKAFNKEEINLDEDTKNDLAPMAIKSSSPAEQKTPPHDLSERDLLQAFEKYKDSLGFQKLMETSLSEYAQDVVASILKGDSVKGILQESLENFKESSHFKQLVEKEISQYIQKQLPLTIKSVVESEIKKIIGD